MTIYMTKVWGYSEPAGPLQFSLQGWRDRARAMLKRGDLVVLVGTMGDETEPAERGRLLGMMEPTTEPVLALDFLKARGPQDFNEAGDYRWPYGLLNRAAWRFDEPRARLSDISARSFSMDAALGIVPLTDAEAAAVLRLPRSASPLATSFRATLRIEGEEAARRRAAPPPSTTRTGVMHLRRAPASTYLFQLEGATVPSFKLGWAFDWKLRMRGFNQSAMPTLGGLRYRAKLHQPWATAMEAFRMEQALLRSFDRARHPQNREILTGLSLPEIEARWYAYVQRVPA